MKSGYEYLRILLKWRKQLIIILLGSFLLSLIFSGKAILQPLYKSTAVVYPINTFSYSEESETEQMLQLFGSKDLHRAVIDSLDLFEHYNIRKDEKYANEKVLKKFQKRISVQRTQYESVRIDAFDKNPEMAFLIAEKLIETYNDFALQLLRKKAEEILAIKEALFLTKKQEVDSIKNYVESIIREFKLTEYHILRESMRGNIQYISSASGREHPNGVFSEKTLDLFYSQRVLESELAILITLKNNYENALSDVNKVLVFADIVTAPDIPEKTAYPVRLLVVLLSVAATLFFAFCIILIIESKNKLRQ